MSNGKNSRETTVEIMVGFFMFMVLIALAVFTIILGQNNFLKKTWPVQIQFDNVGGLRKGDNVVMRGVEIGKIKEMRVEDRGVRVLANLTQPIALHEDYRIEVVSTSILGGKFLNIIEGSVHRSALPEDTVYRGESPINLMDEAALVIRKIHTALEEGKILENLERTMANVDEITGSLREGKGTIGKLLSDDSVYEDLKVLVGDLRTVSAALADGKGTIGRLIQDETVYNDLQGIAENLRTVSQRLAEGKGTLGKLFSEDETFYNDLQATAASLRKITGDLETGDGTLARLINDPDLYNEVRGMVIQIRSAIDDMREASPVTTFSSVVFGAF